MNLPAALEAAPADPGEPGVTLRVQPVAATSAPSVLAALGIYCALVVVLGRDVLLHLNTVIIGPGDFDNFYYAWSIWEFRRDLLAGRLPGFTQDVYGQAGSTPIFVEGFLDHLLALPLQSVLTPLGAYNVTVLLGFVLAALAMYVLASTFTSSWLACVVAGLVFSFSTYHFARALGHLGLATIEVLPFCAWSLIIFWRRPARWRAVLAGAGVGLVPWAAVNYVAYFLVPFLVLLAAAVVVTDWRWVVRGRNLALVGLAAGVALMVALPSLLDYPFLKQDDLAAISAQTSNWELRIYSTNLAALVLPDPYNALLGSHFASQYPPLPGVPERSGFLGIPGLVFASLALVLRFRDGAMLAWVAVAIVGMALGVGAGLRFGNRYLAPFPFYDLVYRLPVLANFGAPDRLVVLTLIAVSMLSAIGVTAVLGLVHGSSRWKLGISVVLLCLATVGLIPNLLFGDGLIALPVQVPQIYRDLASAPDDGLVLEVPPNIGSQQYFQTVSHKRLVAGVVPRLPDPTALQVENVPFYSVLEEGLTPPDSDTGPAASSADIYPLKRFADGLHEHGITYVVLHRLSCIEPAALWPCYSLPHYQETLSFLTNTLGPPNYGSASEGITGWHVSAGNRRDDSQASYGLEAGWLPYLGQLSDGEVWRAIGTRAQVKIVSPLARRSRLHIRASGFVDPMTLEVRFNGRLLTTAWLPAAPHDLDLGPIWLEPGPGGNKLDLHSPQGCVIPDDLDKRYYGPDLGGIGYRCVSFAVERIELSE